jgi:hypothetical protein
VAGDEKYEVVEVKLSDDKSPDFLGVTRMLLDGYLPQWSG